jgi:hypothetical protein
MLDQRVISPAATDRQMSSQAIEVLNGLRRNASIRAAKGSFGSTYLSQERFWFARWDISFDQTPAVDEVAEG